MRSGGDLSHNVNKHRRGISRGPFPPVTLGVCCSRGPPVKVHVRSDASTLAVSARVADVLKMLILGWCSASGVTTSTSTFRRRHFGLILQDVRLLSTIALSRLGNRIVVERTSEISRDIAKYIFLSTEHIFVRTFFLHSAHDLSGFAIIEITRAVIVSQAFGFSDLVTSATSA